MKIDRVVPYLVDNCLLVRVYTDAGIVGTGEAGLWAHHRLVFEAINDLSDYLVGCDPGAMDHHFQAVTRNAHFSGPILSAALSGVDIALWDILGQSVGKPVYELLGGACRKKLKVFANIAGKTVAEHVEQAKGAVDFGLHVGSCDAIPPRMGAAELLALHRKGCRDRFRDQGRNREIRRPRC